MSIFRPIEGIPHVEYLFFRGGLKNIINIFIGDKDVFERFFDMFLLGKPINLLQSKKDKHFSI